MSKKISDIVHEADKIRETKHKVRGSMYGPQTVISGKKTETKFHLGQFVLGREAGGAYKGGHIISIEAKDGKNIYGVELTIIHGGRVILTESVVSPCGKTDF